jgi:hypothetical protein
MNMIELDVYFYLWLGNLLRPVENLSMAWPLRSNIGCLISVRIPLDSFARNAERGRAFPASARLASEIVTAIDQIIPPVVEGEVLPAADASLRIQASDIDRIKALCNGFTATFRQESERSYVLKVEDQRGFSSYSLVEKIESFFSPETWNEISKDAKKEFEESGKCLSLERYTGAGFHALRGVECVIRQRLLALTGALPSNRNWANYIDVLKKNGVAHEVLSVLDNIRTDDRNTLMHPEKWLGVDEAIAVFNISQTAISRLVANAKTKSHATTPSP